MAVLPSSQGGIAADWAMSPDLMEGCHTGKPKHETPILITGFLVDDVITGTPVRLQTIQSHPRLLPLRAMSLSRIVSQYGTGGVSRIPSAFADIFTPMRAICVVTVQLAIAAFPQPVSAQAT